MKIAVGNSRMEKTWTNEDISWDDFCKRVSATVITAETVEDYRKLPKDAQANIKDVGGFVGGHLNQGCRRNGMVACRSMLTLDMDYAEPDTWAQIKMLQDFKCCVYSTHKHMPDKPRLRLIIPLAREITEEEYPAVARMVAQEIGIDLFDDTTYEACRLMYWPSTSSDGVFFFDVEDGADLDPDVYLAKYADWHDASTWPVSSRQTLSLRQTITKQADPLNKPGFVGAFCRAYSIEEAIETFLSDIYAPSSMNGRYDYIPADSTAGVVVYDGKFAFSHHATDPACGELLNAFDLVRLHKFGSLDQNCPPNTPTSKKPSYKSMLAFARKDGKVKAAAVKAKVPKPATGGQKAAWQSHLELDKMGEVKNTLGNLMLILENDVNLEALVYNQLLDGMEIKGEVPWKHPSKFWRDADDAQLVSYVDANYGAFSARNYDIAVTKVADDRSYHPIRNFIDQLPQWDGTERVDTLLVDYLGAEDSPYVRAVTRKTMCAAIKRVQSPGYKFDCMLVLNGPQGIGKSTLIAKLAGEWFSDSLNLSDTKDKTAAEKLQGYWILEIGELAGLRKAEVETLRSFLSRQNDIYRAAYGKRATPHPRQCIFFGTTNAESGYLRDTTGNRRFWPVMTPGGGAKHSWDLSDDDIQQIWAETLVYVQQGEKLFLDASIEALAKDKQREAMESDEREGLVRLYLDTLLPADWDTMDIFERRNFLNGSEFGPASRVGTVQRASVTSMEIWCECFGKDRANLRRADSNEIIGILKRIGWVKSDAKVRIPLYGPQYIFVPGSVPGGVPNNSGP